MTTTSTTTDGMNTRTKEPTTTAKGEPSKVMSGANSSPPSAGGIATPRLPSATVATMHGAGIEKYCHERGESRLNTRGDEDHVGPPLEPSNAVHETERPGNHSVNYATAVMNMDYKSFHSNASTANHTFYQDSTSSTQEDDNASAASSWEISKLVMYGQCQQRHMQHQMWERYDGVGEG